MSYARAGHDMPLLLHQGTVQELGGQGIALGVLDQDKFYIEEQTVTLQPGDRLVLYTDGLTDVMTPQQELFGRERLYHLLNACAANPPDGICQSVFNTLRDYQNGAEQFDDMTLLVVEVTGS
jgi:sigma-B regulation protein RsbU (phosphoserine phosphatase)